MNKIALRDYFAARAMLIKYGPRGSHMSLKRLASSCYSMADAMLAARGTGTYYVPESCDSIDCAMCGESYTRHCGRELKCPPQEASKPIRRKRVKHGLTQCDMHEDESV